MQFYTTLFQSYFFKNTFTIFDKGQWYVIKPWANPYLCEGQYSMKINIKWQSTVL